MLSRAKIFSETNQWCTDRNADYEQDHENWGLTVAGHCEKTTTKNWRSTSSILYINCSLLDITSSFESGYVLRKTFHSLLHEAECTTLHSTVSICTDDDSVLAPRT